MEMNNGHYAKCTRMISLCNVAMQSLKLW